MCYHVLGIHKLYHMPGKLHKGMFLLTVYFGMFANLNIINTPTNTLLHMFYKR